MKKLFTLTAVITLLFTGLTLLSSCNNDDPPVNTLVGNWAGQVKDGTDVINIVLSFTPQGGIGLYEENTISGAKSFQEGTYTVNDSGNSVTLYLDVDGMETFNFTVIGDYNPILTLSSDDATMQLRTSTRSAFSYGAAIN